ncbi:tetratricopeptide repeat protein [Fluviicola taffensis]|uniref:tetratricopeptide repeat protein n=1 Tax=Fluviicola taffensis TaxID=191579 RepID=UPI00313783B4
MNNRSLASFLLTSLIVVISCLSACFGQNAKQQKLLSELKVAKLDSNQVNLLNHLCTDLVDEGDVYNSLKYGWKALTLSKKIDDKNGIIISYSNLGFTYGYDGKYDKALKMYRRSLEYSRKYKQELSFVNALVNIGTIYDINSDYKNSLRCYFYALKYGKRTKNTDLLADVYQNLGVTYYALGNLPESLKMHFKSLRNYDKLRDDSGKVDEYNSIGNVYADLGNEESALGMYQKSLKLALRLQDKDGIGNAYVNIGIVYKDLKRYPEALKMYDKAIRVYSSIDDRLGLSIAYNDKAKLYYNTGKYQEAIAICETSLKNSVYVNEVSETTNSYLTMSKVYIKLGELKKAKSLIDLSLRQSFDIREKQNIRDSYAALIQLDSASNDFKSAFQHQKQWLSYRDSIINQEAEEKSYQTVLQYSFDKKADLEQRKHDKAISQLNQQNKLSSQQKRYLILILIVFSLSGLVIWYFARRSINNRKKLAAFLANENQHKEMLLQEVHHRVNNSLQMISSLLSIQADSTENNEIRDYLLKSENRIQSMSVMHQLLHLGESKLEVNMQDYFNGVIDFYSSLLESKPQVKLKVFVPSVSFHTKLAMPLAIILNELITNSLKYAFPNGEGEIQVSLSPETDSGSWIFSVKDNGVGLQTKNTPVDQSSLGLTLVQLMVKQIAGTITIHSDQQMAVIIVFKDKV